MKLSKKPAAGRTPAAGYRRPAHTFLLRAELWTASGRFFDARYRLEGAKGQLEVRHEPMTWTVQGWLEMEDSKQRLDLTCSVAPSKGGSSASWSLVHPRLGEFEGSFEIGGRRMFSSFRGADGEHSGQLTLTQKGERAYLAEGELRRGRAIVCSWEITLRCQPR